MPIIMTPKRPVRMMLVEACWRACRAMRGSAMGRSRGEGVDSPITGERGEPRASPS